MKWMRVLALLTVILSVQCNTTNRVIKSNLAYLYYEDPTIVHPQFKVLHKNDSLTTIYILVNSSEILYSRNVATKNFMSLMSFHLDIYDFTNEKRLIDSGTVRLMDRTGMEKDKYLIGSVDLHIPRGMYFAEVTFDDIYRMQYVQDVLFVDKTNDQNGQYYQVLDNSAIQAFDNSFRQGERVQIKSSVASRKKLFLRYFDNSGNLPSPPFAVDNLQGFNFEPDSTSVLEAGEDGIFQLVPDRQGIYLLVADENSRVGLTILVCDPFFPHVKTFDAMSKPIRFIMTKQEYQEMIEQPNRKKAIDEFWYGIAGNSERARDVIKAFYGRVEIANRYFTSYYPGWKSDRGLIYIIYGPPNVVFKTPQYERWTYSEKSNTMTEEFTFFKVETPLSHNEYFLSRSANLKVGWYRAIDNWRQGRVY